MVKFTKGMSKGLAVYSEAPGFILRHRMAGFLVLPGLISLGIAIVLLSGAWWLASTLGESAADWGGGSIPFFKDIIYWSVLVVIVVGSLFLFLIVHKQVVIVALAPFLSSLAAKTLAIEEQRVEKGRGAVRDLVRSVRVNRRYLTRELVMTLALLVLGLVIPGIGSIVATIAIFLIEAKYAGNGLVDYALELKRFPVKDSYRFVGERRGVCAGLGTGYLLLMMVPFVGWALAPGLGTVAGTLLASRELRDSPASVSPTLSPSPPPVPG